MGTRATYQIEGKTFYCHWDNYPQGAAYRLFKMLANDSKGGLACRFLRANDDVEFTESHDVHGDTEFQYTVERRLTPTGSVVMLYMKAREPFEQWGKSVDMLLSEFLLIQSKKEGPYKIESCTPNGQLPHQVQARIDEYTKDIGRWVLSGKHAHGYLLQPNEEMIADMEWLKSTYGYHRSLVNDCLCNGFTVDLSVFEFLTDAHRDKALWREVTKQTEAA